MESLYLGQTQGGLGRPRSGVASVRDNNPSVRSAGVNVSGLLPHSPFRLTVVRFMALFFLYPIHFLMICVYNKKHNNIWCTEKGARYLWKCLIVNLIYYVVNDIYSAYAVILYSSFEFIALICHRCDSSLFPLFYLTILLYWLSYFPTPPPRSLHTTFYGDIIWDVILYVTISFHRHELRITQSGPAST